jgi:chromosome segregation ATPase
MTTAADKTQCVICEKEETATSRCVGCSQEFCFDHLTEHRQELKKQLEEIEGHRDLFLQTTDSQKHSVIKEIDQWEHESIEKIKQTAEEIRQIVSININENMDPTKDRLNKLTDQLKQSREQDEIIETDLQKWKEELQQIREQLNRPSNIIIQQSSIPLINKIQVEFPGEWNLYS